MSRYNFSIIIPCYNRPKQLLTCLQSIAALDYDPERFEVLVVDDGSQCPPETIVCNFEKLFDVKLVKQANAGPATARNTGARHAKGSYLAFTDDDCQPTLNWLTNLEAYFMSNPHCAITGRVVNSLPQNPFSTASQDLVEYMYLYFNSVNNRARFFTSNNLAVPTSYFNSSGGFDTNYRQAAGEDRELCDRWLHQGLEIIYAPDVLVYHAHHLTLKSFMRQHFIYGRAAYHFHSQRALRINRPVTLNPLRFYFNLILYPYVKHKSLYSLLLINIMGISQLSTASGFLLDYIKKSV